MFIIRERIIIERKRDRERKRETEISRYYHLAPTNVASYKHFSIVHQSVPRVQMHDSLNHIIVYIYGIFLLARKHI